MLQRQWKDVEILKIPVSAVSRVNFICKKEKALKGLKFSDRSKNTFNDSFRTGVHVEPDVEQLNNLPTQHEIVVEDENVSNDTNSEPVIEEVTVEVEDEVQESNNQAEGDEHEGAESGNSDEENNAEPGNSDEENNVAVENRSDEMQLQDADESDDDEPYCRTRSGRISKPYDYSKHFPETAHVQMIDEGSGAGLWLKPYYYDDEDVISKLGEGTFYRDSCFSENVVEQKIDSVNVDVLMQKWNDQDQHQLHHEALQWINYQGDEIEGLCMKTEHISTQSGVKKHGEEGKTSAMKEMRNLAVKNDRFKEVNYDSLTEDVKKKALPLLMFMVMKRNGTLKSRGVENGSKQRVHIDKNEVSSPTPDFCSLKHACAVASKEGRNTGTVDLPSFFLQTEANEDDEPIIIKVTEVVALLLVECDPIK